MKALVLATLMFCYNSGGCEQKQVKVEQKVCSLGVIEAAFPDGGEWHSGTVRVKCQTS